MQIVSGIRSMFTRRPPTLLLTPDKMIVGPSVAADAKAQENALKGPFKCGGTLQVNDDLISNLNAAFSAEPSAFAGVSGGPAIKIASQGKASLGEDAVLHRYYGEDGAWWVQCLSTSDGAGEVDLFRVITLLRVPDELHPDHKKWALLMRRPKMMFQGAEYTRHWFAGAEAMNPVGITEVLSCPREQGSACVDQDLMLFSRTNSAATEFLQVAIERKVENDMYTELSVSFSIGLRLLPEHYVYSD